MKVLEQAELTTANARKKLASGVHWRALDAEAHIGYRKGKRAAVWFTRWRNHYEGAAYKQKPVGPANDTSDKPTAGLLTFYEAEKLAREIVERERKAAEAKADGPIQTVGSVVDAYIAKMDAREEKRVGRPIRSDAGQRLRKYVVSHKVAGLELHALKDKDLEKWVADLPSHLKATAKHRTATVFKAALNAAKAPKEAVRDGLRIASEDDDEYEVAREGQVLSDAQVTRILAAAREVDAEQGYEGDLYRLVLVLATTGARYSQITRMRVADVQRDNSRLLVPSSRKGKGGQAKPPIVVPVGKDVLDALLPATTGRGAGARLLERWHHERINGGVKRERNHRREWRKGELTRPWWKIRKRAKLAEDVVAYALRHSSIVRGIRANLPIRLVAALHDTSAVMIERHYSRWITSGLEDMARQAIVPLVPQEGDGKVTHLRRPA